MLPSFETHHIYILDEIAMWNHFPGQDMIREAGCFLERKPLYNTTRCNYTDSYYMFVLLEGWGSELQLLAHTHARLYYNNYCLQINHNKYEQLSTNVDTSQQIESNC